MSDLEDADRRLPNDAEACADLNRIATCVRSHCSHAHIQSLSMRGIALSASCAQIAKQLRKARVLDEEDKRERAVRAAAANLADGSAAAPSGERGGMADLQTVRRWNKEELIAPLPLSARAIHKSLES